MVLQWNERSPKNEEEEEEGITGLNEDLKVSRLGPWKGGGRKGRQVALFRR